MKINGFTLYPQLIKSLLKYRPNFPLKSIHNRYRMALKKDQISVQTYEGYMMCGNMTYILHEILLKNKLVKKSDIRLLEYREGYGDYLETHVHLVVNNKYVIDPTYRQFFYVNGDNHKMGEYLYEKMPPIYIGTYDELFSEIDKLKNMDDQLECMKHIWKKDLIDVTYRLDS